ncbi:YIP1 family protein [Deinococcus planocerae]|uniref:YIP1 family protein n=1 Tax=Deinococcus planocerae TaxID=1737569 RepID=UPI000C7EAD88|nr:YIP1 family protein [Deinococcus planocerae]
MARRDRAPTPPPPPDAPLPAELLSGPGAFFRRLGASEPRAWRYLAPVFLAALLSGVLYALLVRPTVGLGGGGGGPLVHATNAFGTLFLTVFGYALMAGLGFLGAGRGGRAAEVYGATFALLPPLLLPLIVLSLVLPGPALPDPAPGTEIIDVQRAALRAVGQSGLSRVSILLTVLATLAQFVLAYRGFRELTGSRRRALLGTLTPLVPALLLTLVGFGPLLAGIF